jgi:hypothetical protein
MEEKHGSNTSPALGPRPGIVTGAGASITPSGTTNSAVICHFFSQVELIIQRRQQAASDGNANFQNVRVR